MQDKRPQRPKAHPRPRASNVGRAVTRGAVKVSPRPAQTRRAVRAARPQKRVTPYRTSGVAVKTTIGAIKASPHPQRTAHAADVQYRKSQAKSARTEVQQYPRKAALTARLGAKKVAAADTRAQLIHDVFPDLQRDSKRFWPLVRRHYGLPKGTPAPNLKVGEPRLEKRAAAYVYPDAPGKPTVYAESSLLRKYKHPKTKDEALSVLLHEWAHTRQKPSVRGRAAEGGAQAYARAVSQKLGLDPYEASPAYRKYARRTERKKGRRYVLKGQFK